MAASLVVILANLLQTLANAVDLTDVNVAAGVAQEELAPLLEMLKVAA